MGSARRGASAFFREKREAAWEKEKNVGVRPFRFSDLLKVGDPKTEEDAQYERSMNPSRLKSKC